MILEEKIKIVFNEGRVDELYRACDNYIPVALNGDDNYEWTSNFREYVGLHHYGKEVWKFSLPLSGSIYFIGSYNEVKQKINATL